MSWPGLNGGKVSAAILEKKSSRWASCFGIFSRTNLTCSGFSPSGNGMGSPFLRPLSRYVRPQAWLPYFGIGWPCYLDLSLSTQAIFALSFLQSNDVTQTRNTYWIVFVVISAVIYLAGIVAFWKFGIITWHRTTGSSATSRGPVRHQSCRHSVPKKPEMEQTTSSGFRNRLSSTIRWRSNRRAAKASDEEKGQGPKGKENAPSGESIELGVMQSQIIAED